MSHLPTLAALTAFALCTLASGSAGAAAIGVADPLLVGVAGEPRRLGVSLGGRTGPRGEGIAAQLSLRPATARDSTTLWAGVRQDRLELDGVAFDERVETESVDADLELGLVTDLEREVGGVALGLRVAVSVAEREVLDRLVVGGRRARGETRAETLSVALAGRAGPIRGTPLRPYGRLGAALERRSVTLDVDGAGNADRDLDETELRLDPDLALGVALPLGRFVLFGALEYRETASIGAGVRFEL